MGVGNVIQTDQSQHYGGTGEVSIIDVAHQEQALWQYRAQGVDPASQSPRSKSS